MQVKQGWLIYGSEKMLYISMIGSLLYVTSSRPNVIHIVGLLVRFQSTLKEKPM